MKFLVVVLSMIFFMGGGPVLAQSKPSYMYVEETIEADQVFVAYSGSSGVVEVRIAPCESCEFRSFQPEKGISFQLGGMSLTAGEVVERLSGEAATVFLNKDSGRVSRINFFQTNAGDGV